MNFNLFHNWIWLNLIKFSAIFLVGATIWLFRDRLPDSGWFALLSAAGFVGGLWLPTYGHAPAYYFSWPGVVAPLLAYPLLWLGAHLPLQRVGATNDYSYGIYIYAFPVGVLLALWNVQRWGYVPFVLLNVLGMIPFAVGSWWLVERHALKFKKLEWRAAWLWLVRAPKSVKQESVPD